MPVTHVNLKAGDVARFPASGPRVDVVSPSDLRMSIPAPEGYIDLWLPEAGAWTVDGRTVTVLAADPVDPPRDQRAPLSELRATSGSSYEAGDAFTVRATYRDPATLVSVDPDLVRFRVWHPAWDEATPLSHSKVGVGLYEASGTLWDGGEYYVEAEASGAWRAVDRLALRVAPSLLPP